MTMVSSAVMLAKDPAGGDVQISIPKVNDAIVQALGDTRICLGRDFFSGETRSTTLRDYLVLLEEHIRGLAAHARELEDNGGLTVAEMIRVASMVARPAPRPTPAPIITVNVPPRQVNIHIAEVSRESEIVRDEDDRVIGTKTRTRSTVSVEEE